VNKLWIIAQKDILEAFRSRTTYIYIVILILLTFVQFSRYTTVINNLESQNASTSELINASQIFLNQFAYTLPLWYAILICTIFATYSVIVDKAKRNIESLMATPVSLNQIWMGKCLAVTLPSIVIALVVSIIAFIVINFIAIMPDTNQFIFPEPSAIVSALVLLPMLIFAIVAIVLYLQLTISNPRFANFVFTGIFFVVFFGSSVLTGSGINFNFSYVFLGLIAICAGIAFILSRFLTKEKVLLSSKG
jgi:ABC-type Na+ efflux pump permease subunit